jgi:hypothetical protein
MRLPWRRRRRQDDKPVVVALPFSTTRWVPETLPPAPRAEVTLGFRDGTTLAVSPHSAEGTALRAAAAALVNRKVGT